ncbi:hypothetical protein RGU70_10150 [Herbaspirillum sp. RTI4]|uniref:hypothetical protein n=1 Tax=Herbaspirillum sp. RTI4 TaxID=3048640 RepID=UPI002AB5D00E|nr:hypothetical protein [Herbaspirillum sp. RTI4]MDY7578684.1 hypothetical protein [Herbaspirillum sp. RTI4]MEA9980618.1 hypothetical protein [Herbaspirillum sp. RTI4]
MHPCKFPSPANPTVTIFTSQEPVLASPDLQRTREWAADLREPGRWQPDALPILAQLFPRLPGWPCDRALHIFNPTASRQPVFSVGDEQCKRAPVRLLTDGLFFTAIDMIEDAWHSPVPKQTSKGDSFFSAIAQALGPDDLEVLLLRNPHAGGRTDSEQLRSAVADLLARAPDLLGNLVLPPLLKETPSLTALQPAQNTLLPEEITPPIITRRHRLRPAPEKAAAGLKRISPRLKPQNHTSVQYKIPGERSFCATHLKEIKEGGKAKILANGGLKGVARQHHISYSYLRSLIDRQGDLTNRGEEKMKRSPFYKNPITARLLIQIEALGGAGIRAAGGLRGIAEMHGVSTDYLRQLMHEDSSLTERGQRKKSTIIPLPFFSPPPLTALPEPLRYKLL